MSMSNTRFQAIDAYLLRAKLLVAQFRFEEAAKTYEAVIKEVPDNFEANFEYAVFCENLNRFRPASVRVCSPTS